MRIAFYAPLKAVDHPVPSGDRSMARALVRALERSGHRVTPVSTLRSFLAAPDAEAQQRIAQDAATEVERIAADWRAGAPPEAWFTYHNHYKAPDLLGPVLARRFALPFLMAEASHAERRADWGSWQMAAVAAIQAADTHLCFTYRDKRGLEPLLEAGTPVLDLPPFIDMAGIDAPPAAPAHQGPIHLVTVAMMRQGDKLASYALLAEALTSLPHDASWQLAIVGDGPARRAVERLFAPLPEERLTWHGALDRAEVVSQVRDSNLFVWPGLGEAFGLAYLEAQAVGVPVLALDVAGVPAVVEHGRTGLLVREPTASAFAEALRSLMADRAALAHMGIEARAFVEGGRTLGRASARLDDALRRCIERKGRWHG